MQLKFGMYFILLLPSRICRGIKRNLFCMMLNHIHSCMMVFSAVSEPVSAAHFARQRSDLIFRTDVSVE